MNFDEVCERCGKPIDPKTSVAFELSFVTNIWHEADTCPPEESQGHFYFGPDCARAVRRDRINWKRIGKAAQR